MEAGRFAGASAPRGGARRSRCPLGKKVCALGGARAPGLARAALRAVEALARRVLFPPRPCRLRGGLAPAAPRAAPATPGRRRPPGSLVRAAPLPAPGLRSSPLSPLGLAGPRPRFPPAPLCRAPLRPGGAVWAPCGALFVPPPLPALPALRRGLFCGSVCVSFVLLSLGEAAATRSAGTVVQGVTSGIVHQRRPSCLLPKINKTVKFC